jgi:hypothetical protein
MKFFGKMGMERSGIAAGGTIKEGLHKTPTTVFTPQLFDARFLLRDTALLILHALSGAAVRRFSGVLNSVAF